MSIKSKYLQFAKELKKHLSGPEYRLMPIERAFIRWFILARFGLSDGAALVDGRGDGGIDAVFAVDQTHYIVQSKYEKQPRLSAIRRNELGAFEGLADKFTNKLAQADFDTWLASVRPQLKPIYSKLRRQAIRRPSSVRFIFTTTKRFTLEPGEKVEVEDIQHVTALWDLHSRGFTPPVEHISLTLQHQWEIPIGGGFRTYVGLASTADFLRLMENDKNERLFAQNVRTDLGSEINKGIRRTYEQESERFWLFNNGLYIVCSRIDPIGGNRLRLKYPSIINGSQTLHSIKHASRHHPCKVLVRILVMDSVANPDLLSDVIRRTNTQNPMNLINLSAQDPFQLNIARYLDRYHVFYERREKEWGNEKRVLLPDYRPIKVKEIAQWLSLLHREIGFGLARTRVSELFQPTFYNWIFSDFDARYSSDSYKSLALLVWSGEFIKNAIRSLPRSKRAFGKMAQLVLIRGTYDAIKSNRRLQEAILRMLESHKVGSTFVPSKLKRWYRSAVKGFVAMQKRVQRRDPQIDFSNYFKRNDLTAAAYRRVCSRTATNKLAKLLAGNLTGIE